MQNTQKIKIISGLMMGALCVGAWFGVSQAAAGGAGAPLPITTSTADSQTIRAVNAGNAFLATLNTEQQNAVLFAWTDDAQRKNWSNFPDGAVIQRRGLKWGDLNAAQRGALVNLLGAVLSPEGVKLAREQMAADDQVVAYQAKQRAAGLISSPGGGQAPAGGGASGTPPAGATGRPAAGSTGTATRPQVNFGSAYYYVSFLGTPSATSPWMLQFGGHHLAINATVAGSNITLSPTLTGGEPLKFTQNGEPIYIVKPEATAADLFMKSLTPAQRQQAIRSNQRIDLVLGPGQDGKVLQPEGVLGQNLSAPQQQLLLNVIRTRASILNANDLAPKMAAIEQHLNQTSFAWYGPTSPLGAGYFRIVGPTVIIEFSPQANDGDATDHAHNMYREPANEYGAGWSSLQ